jgi:hypothetical protein
MHPTFEDLKADIVTGRTCGCTTVELVDRQDYPGNDVAAVDVFVSTLGFDGLANQWQSVSPSEAQIILTRVLERDLAYNLPILAESAALHLADRFLALFNQDVHCFTNGTYHQLPSESSPSVQVGPGWDPISDSTFDTGIVCLDNARMGIVWVEDED